MGSSFSVFNCAHLGSTVSLRSYLRCGSALSIFGRAQLASSLSIMDFNHFGSSLSVRSFTRLGSSLTLTSAATMKFGNTNDAKFVQFGTNAANTYFYYAQSTTPKEWGFYFAGNRVMAIQESPVDGNFHGSWTRPPVNWAMSDRRMKKDIKPLRRTLQGLQAESGDDRLRGDSALWMLRQLRPVSYSFKKGAESKYMRFGFIADELEAVVPSLVRSSPEKQGLKDFKAVQMKDIIALLAAAGQSQQEVIETQERLMDQVEAEFEAFKAELKVLNQLKEKKRQANRALACGATRKKRRRPWWR